MPNFRVTIIRRGYRSNADSIRTGFREAVITLDAPDAETAGLIALEQAEQPQFGAEHDQQYEGNENADYGDEYDCEFEAGVVAGVA